MHAYVLLLQTYSDLLGFLGFKHALRLLLEISPAHLTKNSGLRALPHWAHHSREMNTLI